MFVPHPSARLAVEAVDRDEAHLPGTCLRQADAQVVR